MNDASFVADYCRQVLKLDATKLGDSYFYNSLTLCIIDAVFSIRAKYETTMNTVERYCEYFNLAKYRTIRNSLPEIYEQQSVKDLIQSFKLKDTEYFADKVFKNRQRTSSKNGILKSEAVLRFASVLEYYDINYFQDMHKVLLNKQFEGIIKDIPGQRSGISLKYFFMLAGADDIIKPDMHIINFLKEAFILNYLSRSVTLNYAQELLSGACLILKPDYPFLTPRLLDNVIWTYQREHYKPLQYEIDEVEKDQDKKPIKKISIMPNKGDLFKGKVNDLVQDDESGWRRRDISFYKHDLNFDQRFEYPSHGDRIELIDTSGNQYELSVTKPDNDYTVCLGTPSRLKAWYKLKGFDKQQVDPDTWIYFQYTGLGNKYLILTQKEKNLYITKIDEDQTTKVLKTWADRSQFHYSGSVRQGTIINYGSCFSISITASQYSDLLKHFQNKTVDIGTSHTGPPTNSVGEWLQQNVTKTGIASYVGPILISENYAVKIGSSQIKFVNI